MGTRSDGRHFYKNLPQDDENKTQFTPLQSKLSGNKVNCPGQCVILLILLFVAFIIAMVVAFGLRSISSKTVPETSTMTPQILNTTVSSKIFQNESTGNKIDQDEKTNYSQKSELNEISPTEMGKNTNKSDNDKPNPEKFENTVNETSTTEIANKESIHKEIKRNNTKIAFHAANQPSSTTKVASETPISTKSSSTVSTTLPPSSTTSKTKNETLAAPTTKSTSTVLSTTSTTSKIENETSIKKIENNEKNITKELENVNNKTDGENNTKNETNEINKETNRDGNRTDEYSTKMKLIEKFADLLHVSDLKKEKLKTFLGAVMTRPTLDILLISIVVMSVGMCLLMACFTCLIARTKKVKKRRQAKKPDGHILGNSESVILLTHDLSEDEYVQM